MSYAGHWDPEPYAWTRYARWFRRQTNYALDVKPVAMRSLDPHDTPFASLTGAMRYNPTLDEINGIKNYVESGGVLLIDTTGGSPAFDDSARNSLLAAAFPSIIPRLLSPTHPVLQPGRPGMTNVSHPLFRAYTHEKSGTAASRFDYFKAGKGHVISTSADLTSGLLNTDTWGIIGYDPGYSQQFMKNLILWTIDGQKED